MNNKFYSAEVISLEKLIKELVSAVRTDSAEQYNDCIEKINNLLNIIDFDVIRGYDDGK